MVNTVTATANVPQLTTRWYRARLKHITTCTMHYVEIFCVRRGRLWYATSEAMGFVLDAMPHHNVLVAIGNFVDTHDMKCIELKAIDRAGNTLNPPTPTN